MFYLLFFCVVFFLPLPFVGCFFFWGKGKKRIFFSFSSLFFGRVQAGLGPKKTRGGKGGGWLSGKASCWGGSRGAGGENLDRGGKKKKKGFGGGTLPAFFPPKKKPREGGPISPRTQKQNWGGGTHIPILNLFVFFYLYFKTEGCLFHWLCPKALGGGWRKLGLRGGGGGGGGNPAGHPARINFFGGKGGGRGAVVGGGGWVLGPTSPNYFPLVVRGPGIPPPGGGLGGPHFWGPKKQNFALNPAGKPLSFVTTLGIVRAQNPHPPGKPNDLVS